ncbi:MAG: hypothetical protein WCE75_06525 [Terracidiphilus sp.]
MATKPTTVVSMRLPAASAERLKRMARRHGWTASDTSARLVEEGLRRQEFALIDFRDSPIGRQAYIEGSRLTIWQMADLLRAYKQDAGAVAKHLEWPVHKVQAAVNYIEAFPDEIAEQLAEYDAIDFAALKRILPNIQERVVDLSEDHVEAPAR